MTWTEFKPQLFEMLERRRAKAAMFRVEQWYNFVVDCSKLFNTAKPVEAERARSRIKDQGTFLLIADTLTEFLSLFPGESESQEDGAVHDQVAIAAQPGGAEPSTQPVARPAQNPPPTLQTEASARREAGRPFRRS